MDDARWKTQKLERDVLDLRGLRCPLPALRTAKRLREIGAGDGLVVLADDPLARLDIAHLCGAEGHVLEEAVEIDAYMRFRIVRRRD